MKTMHEIKEKKVMAVLIDPSLDKYDNIVSFLDKLAKANKNLKSRDLPTCLAKRKVVNQLMRRYS